MRSYEGVFEKHGDRERSDSARYRCNGTSNLANGGKVHVANQASFNSIDAHIDYHSAGLYHIRFYELRLADSYDQDVGRFSDLGQVRSSAMAKRDGRIAARAALREHDRKRAADNIAAAEHDYVLARRFDSVADQNLLYALRSAWQKSWAPLDESADVFGVERVDIFGGRNRAENTRSIDLRRQRQLHENPMHGVVFIEFSDEL